MTLNELEKALIKNFLMHSGNFIEDDATFFSTISIKSREYTGVGFFTKFHQTEKLKINHEQKSSRLGNLGAKLNNAIDTGYLFYIENGYLELIEGYTYDSDWPNEIHSIYVYSI
jgi:hypothetical protein